MAVSLGADGAFVASAEAEVRLRPPAEDVVSTVGGGDAIVAGILAGLEWGRSMLNRGPLRRGTGERHLPHVGGQPAREDDVARLRPLLAAGN